MEVNSEQPEDSESSRGDGSDETVVFETTYEYGEQTDGLTVVIIDAIAQAKEVSPTELVPRISESVDPDALERVFRPLPDGSERSGHLTFSLLEYDVTVHSDGTIRIVEASD